MRSWTRGEAQRTGRSGNAPVHLTRPYEDRHGAGEQATMGLGDYQARPGRSPRTGKKARTDGSVNSRFGQNKTFRMVWARGTSVSPPRAMLRGRLVRGGRQHRLILMQKRRRLILLALIVQP